MYLRYNFTDLESMQTTTCVSDIIDASFDPDTHCTKLQTSTGKQLYLDTDHTERHDAFMEAFCLALATKEPFMSLQGVVLTIPDKEYNDYLEYYNAALDLFATCRGYILFVGSHSYTF